DPRARLLAAHPVGIAAAMRLARRRLAEDPLIGDLPIAVDVPPWRTARRPGPNREPIGRELVKARAEPGIDVVVDDLGGRLDRRVGVIYAQPVLHHAPSLNRPLCSLYTGQGCAERPLRTLPKTLDPNR